MAFLIGKLGILRFFLLCLFEIGSEASIHFDVVTRHVFSHEKHPTERLVFGASSCLALHSDTPPGKVMDGSPKTSPGFWKGASEHLSSPNPLKPQSFLVLQGREQQDSRNVCSVFFKGNIIFFRSFMVWWRVDLEIEISFMFVQTPPVLVSWKTLKSHGINQPTTSILLLMEEILHHLGWLKPY